jgi:hypothetical protein
LPENTLVTSTEKFHLLSWSSEKVEMQTGQFDLIEFVSNSAGGKGKLPRRTEELRGMRELYNRLRTAQESNQRREDAGRY